MSDQLLSYMVGQLLHRQQSTESKIDTTHKKLDDLQQTVEEARSWAQRLVWLSLALVGAVVSNWDPNRVGEVIAQILRVMK